MVIDTEYRPSAASKMEHKSSNASEVALKQAKKMVASTDELSAYLSGLSEQEQAQSLELAHAYARYLAVQKKQANPVLRKRTLEILSARCKMQTDAGFGEIPPAKRGDHQGHRRERRSRTTRSAF